MYRYNVQSTIHFVLRSLADGSLVTSATPSCYVAKDSGAQASASNAASHLGNGQWALTLTATEMQAEILGVLITASGCVPVEREINTSWLPAVTPGAAGGVFIAGSNATTTVNFTGNLSGSVGSVTGSVGSISGVTFPTNFASLGINVSGHISRVTLADTITTYTGNTVQTGDSFSRIGATGSGLTSITGAVAGVQSDTTTLTGRLTSARAGYMDNLNVGGSVASASDVSLVYGRLGAPAGASISADIAAKATQTSVDDIPTNAEFNARTIAAASYATATSVADVYSRLGAPTGDSIAHDIFTFKNDLVGEISVVQLDTDEIRIKLPRDDAKIAGEGSTAKNLDQVSVEETWTDEEKEQIRYRLGVDGTRSTPVSAEPAVLPLTSNGVTNFETFYNNGGNASSKTIANVTAPKTVTITIPSN